MIRVMSRNECIRYCNKEHENETIIISISDPYMVYSSSPHTSRKNRVVSVLPLSFCDADQPGIDIYGRETCVNDLMSDEDADKVVDFVSRHPDVDIIVHCDAGISRSSGVAAAILKYQTGSDSQIFNSAHYCPNMWAYRKTLEAFYRKEETT